MIISDAASLNEGVSDTQDLVAMLGNLVSNPIDAVLTGPQPRRVDVAIAAAFTRG